jgi:hypothetical protein
LESCADDGQTASDEGGQQDAGQAHAPQDRLARGGEGLGEGGHAQAGGDRGGDRPQRQHDASQRDRDGDGDGQGRPQRTKVKRRRSDSLMGVRPAPGRDAGGARGTSRHPPCTG